MQTNVIAVGYNLTLSRRELIQNLFSYCNINLKEIVDLLRQVGAYNAGDTPVVVFGEVANQLIVNRVATLPAPSRLVNTERNKEARQQAIDILTKLSFTKIDKLEQAEKQIDLAKPEKQVIDLQRVKPEELIAMLSKDTTGNVILDCHPTIEIRKGREEKREDGKVVLTIEEAVIISLSANLLGANRVRVEEKKDG